ncbi:MAG: ankyrin repeat domain-containing protein, partial [Proteobacteria bacterium]|nr:ankyrin repeat domain-containing protein [Pseudomonadota bacterium]
EMLQDYLITEEFSEFIHSDEIKNVFLNHPLILELRDDLFNLLHPLEDQLYEAISWGNLDKVKELTEKGADLNCSHPDFKYSALMCAVELDNDEIAKFLVQHGANIEQSDILT